MSASDPIDEKVRWALLNRLIEVLGEEEAHILMESLPPVVWRQIATKDDLKALSKEFRVELDAFKSEVRGELKEFRGELKEMRGEFALQLARTTRTLVFTFVGIAITMLGAMVAIVQTAPPA